jgi:GT2 family glycosyltransferase
VVHQLTQDQEVIVIDNSPTGSALPIAEEFNARWIPELRPGSAWARNRGFREAKHDIIAYIDDDCQADVVWVQELLSLFADPTVGVVTGSVLAAHPNLAIPHLIDAEYPFHRGWSATRYNGSTGTKWSPFDVWRVGVGGTMAWRKSLLTELGGFDPALGAGTPAGSCEDIDALRRALCAGAVICYQPTALVWHKHPENMQGLQAMLIRYAVTLGAHAAKAAVEESRWKGLLYLVCDWYWQITWALRLLLSSTSATKVRMPVMSLLMQPPASIIGMFRFIKYRRALRNGEAVPNTASVEQVTPQIAPLRSGVVDVQVELTGEVIDQTLSSPARLLVRLDNRPILATEVTAEERLSQVIEREVPASLRCRFALPAEAATKL